MEYEISEYKQKQFSLLNFFKFFWFSCVKEFQPAPLIYAFDLHLTSFERKNIRRFQFDINDSQQNYICK